MADQGRRDRRADGPAVVHGHRGRQRREDGRRRDQRRRRPARASRSSCIVEDGETTDSVAEACAAKLVQRGSRRRDLRRHLQLDPAGDQGVPRSTEGKTLYIYPEQYEGQESDPLIFCTGPVPAQQVDPLIPWLMERDGREEVRAAVGRLHLAADHEREGPRDRHRAAAARSSRRTTTRSITRTTARRSRRSCPAAPRWSSTRSFRPGSCRSSSSCTTPASRSAAGTSSARTSTRPAWASCRPSRSRACTAASTTTRTSTTRSARSCSTATTGSTRAAPCSPAAARARACTGA